MLISASSIRYNIYNLYVFLPWQRLFEECPERWRLAHIDPIEPTYNTIYRNDWLSRSTAYTVFTLMVALRRVSWKMETRPRRSLRANLYGIYPDGRPSRSMAYTGLHPDGDSLGSLLKDRGSLTLDAQSQFIMGYTLMVARAGQQPIRVFTLTVTLREVSWKTQTRPHRSLGASL